MNPFGREEIGVDLVADFSWEIEEWQHVFEEQRTVEGKIVELHSKRRVSVLCHLSKPNDLKCVWVKPR